VRRGAVEGVLDLQLNEIEGIDRHITLKPPRNGLTGSETYMITGVIVSVSSKHCSSSSKRRS